MAASARARTPNMVAFDRVAQLATRVNANVLAHGVRDHVWPVRARTPSKRPRP
jgi:hypothetical protein